MESAAIIACWIGLLAVGAFLRFDHLTDRPFHSDEATGARITAKRMESGDYQFDPIHFHGPTLSSFAMPLCRARGETSWRAMTKDTLRILPALAGTLLLLVPLLGRRRWGDGPMLLAAAFLATSPLLVYYSRMFIHESLLVLFGMLALFSLLGKPRPVLAGLLIGLMFATKESFAISLIAWSAAGLLVAIENRQLFDRAKLAAAARTYCRPLLICLLTATLTAAFFYTDGFRHPQGAIDAVRTFFVYKTTDGHEKAFPYYFEFLLRPRKVAGVWWGETPVVLFALLAYAATFRPGTALANWRPVIRFLSYAAAGHFLIYSLIAYKTPWLACLPWAHVCLLAGFGTIACATMQLPWKPVLSAIALTALAAFTYRALAYQFRVSRLACGRYASDGRNPYAYVPTKRDVENLEQWLKELQALTAQAPAIPLEPVVVVGSGYWPLPWYLRSFDKIGYPPTPPEDLAKYPLVFALSDSLEAVTAKLATSHTPVPRGLREDVPLTLFIRNDVWERWMAGEQR